MAFLEVSNINVYYGGIQVLYEVNLEIREGTITSVIGSNGAGKSTLLKTILGMLHPTVGVINFNEERIDNLPPHQIVEKGIIYVPEGRRIFPNMTVQENLELGAYTKNARKHLQESLEKTFQLFPILKERKQQRAGTLSGGEMQMLAVGRGLMGMPKLLMLDEPSLGLMPLVVTKIFNVIKEVSEQGITVLLVEQNVTQALELSHTGYVLETGKIVLQGEGKRLVQNDYIRKAYMGL